MAIINKNNQKMLISPINNVNQNKKKFSSYRQANVKVLEWLILISLQESDVIFSADDKCINKLKLFRWALGNSY